MLLLSRGVIVGWETLSQGIIIELSRSPEWYFLTSLQFQVSKSSLACWSNFCSVHNENDRSNLI